MTQIRVISMVHTSIKLSLDKSRYWQSVSTDFRSHYHPKINTHPQHPEIQQKITLSSTIAVYSMMADSMQTYEIVAGIFVFLTAILFASRARRYKSGFTAGAEGGHKEAEAS